MLFRQVLTVRFKDVSSPSERVTGVTDLSTSILLATLFLLFTLNWRTRLPTSVKSRLGRPTTAPPSRPEPSSENHPPTAPHHLIYAPWTSSSLSKKALATPRALGSFSIPFNTRSHAHKRSFA